MRNLAGSLEVGRLHDQVIDEAVRFVDVMEGAIPQTAHRRVIFLASDIIVSFIEQLKRAVIAAGAIHLSIDRRMVVQILAIVNRSLLNLANGFVDLVDGALFFFVHVMGRSQVLQVGTRVPQVAKGMQVRRMSPWFVGKAQGGADRNKKHE
ncbi:MAG: hypothetical protein WCA20_14295 [Candidatus Sulfotelmatobacter sp.]